MRLEAVELRSFRSYPQLDFTPDPGTNLLIGDNGAGKTNLLEAIAYLSTLRSFRKAPDDALIASNADAAIVRGAVAAPVSQHMIEIELSRSARRRVLLDGKRPARNAELRARLRCVTFLPDDLELAKGSAGQRRSLLDDIAAQLRVTAGADQAELERALSKVASQPVTVHASGRTDSGVHATRQIVHFDAPADRSTVSVFVMWPGSISANNAADSSTASTWQMPC